MRSAITLPQKTDAPSASRPSSTSSRCGSMGGNSASIRTSTSVWFTVSCTSRASMTTSAASSGAGEELAAGKPQPRGRRACRVLPDMPQGEPESPQRIDRQHHGREQQECRHAEIDGRAVQPLQDVARIGRAKPPAHRRLQRRPRVPEDHPGDSQRQERECRESPVDPRRQPSAFPRQHAGQHHTGQGERDAADAEPGVATTTRAASAASHARSRRRPVARP